ncbi:hypothetical protein Plec18167_001890, partial [Paecilomyces lecythidis]
MDDLDIARQLEGAIIGSIKVRELDRLEFEGLGVYGARSLSEGNIKRLLHRFEKEGCRRLDPLTWIPAEVSPVDMGHIRMANSFEVLTRDNPKEIIIPPGCTVHCFQGRHRIEAATYWLKCGKLAPHEMWWNLILYDASKLSLESRRKLRETEDSSQQFCDGDIFRNIRYYQRRGETEAAGEWLAKWTPSKCRDFKQIYEPKADNHREFRENLDALLEFPALWRSWLMGAHLLSLQCPEELAEAIGQITLAWDRLTCGQHHLLDPETVGYLEGRCPSLSEVDRSFINVVFDDNLVFSRSMDPHTRSELRKAALDYPGIIPSLKLFFENIKYLRPIVYILKRLLPPNFRGTIRKAMQRCYIRPSSQVFPVEISENNFREQEHTDVKYGFWSAYRQ